MKSIAYIIGAGVIFIGGVATYFINKRLQLNEFLPLSRIEYEDIFGKATFKKWLNFLNLPPIDSTYRFFVIKLDRTNLNNLHVSQNDKLKLKNVSNDKVVVSLHVTDSDLNIIASTVYICNSISSEVDFDNEVTEILFK